MTLSHMLMLIALATGAASGGWVHAQTNYPAKAIRLVVPLAPGGPSDILARTMAQKLTESLKDSSNNNLNKINYSGLFAATSGNSIRRETHRARWQERRVPRQRF